jgi:hypothetical protein
MSIVARSIHRPGLQRQNPYRLIQLPVCGWRPDIEVTPEMVSAAKMVLAADCWDDGVLSFSIGIDAAVEEALRAAIAAHP